MAHIVGCPEEMVRFCEVAWVGAVLAHKEQNLVVETPVMNGPLARV
jgi:hypothetical protein